MMIIDVIKRLENEISDIRKQVAVLEAHRERMRLSKKYCGKCDDGKLRIAWPEDVKEYWGPDIRAVMKNLMPNGYLSDCECIGGGKYANQVLQLEESIAEKSEALERWKSKRAALEKKVGSKVIDKGLNNYMKTGNESEIVKLAHWMNAKAKRNLILIGKSGAGKSHLASAIANDLLTSEIDCHYTNGYAIDDLTNLDLTPSRMRSCAVDRMAMSDILVIDDASKSKMTSALFSHVWFPVLKQRTDNGLPTVFTFDKTVRKTWHDSGIDKDQLEALYNRIETVVAGETIAEFVFLKIYENNTARKSHERADIYG